VNQILVVDDDLELAKLVAFGLRLRGYAAQIAANGREALTLLQERTFDAIVLDWNMSVMGGEEFLKQYQRRTLSRPPTPIIVITARTDAELRARQLGAVDVVAKPFSLNELVRVLLGVLGDSQ
jgi:DNA-binding response OmpR family regulator